MTRSTALRALRRVEKQRLHLITMLRVMRAKGAASLVRGGR